MQEELRQAMGRERKAAVFAGLSLEEYLALSVERRFVRKGSLIDKSSPLRLEFFTSTPSWLRLN
jgi:hypothetical protein